MACSPPLSTVGIHVANFVATVENSGNCRRYHPWKRCSLYKCKIREQKFGASVEFLGLHQNTTKNVFVVDASDETKKYE